MKIEESYQITTSGNGTVKLPQEILPRLIGKNVYLVQRDETQPHNFYILPVKDERKFGLELRLTCPGGIVIPIEINEQGIFNINITDAERLGFNGKATLFDQYKIFFVQPA